MFIRSFAWLVLIPCFALNLAAEEFRFSGDLGLRPIGEPARKSFAWAKDLGVAFSEAKKRDVPMIVFFANTNDVHATNFLVELGADGLSEFVDQAVFAYVAIPAEGSPWDDPQGQKLVSELKLSVSPTISIMSPNPLSLNEGLRLEGYFEMHELKSHLAKGIALAMSPEKTWRQPTIEGLVKQFSDAMRTGDLLMYTACLEEPRRSAMEKLMNLQINIGHAKRRLLSAIDKKFGTTVERLSSIEDDEAVASELRKVTSMEIIRTIPQGDQTEVRVLFTNRDSSGASSQEERRMIVARGQFGYRIVSEQDTQWSEQTTQLVEKMNPVIADLDRITEGVRSGMFSNATSALELAKSAYEQRTSTRATVSK